MLDAVILAGDRKSLTQLNGKPMVQYVADALSSSQYIGKVFVVGNFDGKINNAIIVNSSGTIYDNVYKGMASTEGNKFLIATADIPLLSKESIDDYIKKTLEIEADFYLPLIEKKSANKIKNNRKYRITLKEGDFRMGYIFVVSKSILNDKKTHNIFEDIFINKKSGMNYLAKFLSFKQKMQFLFMYKSRKLTIPFLEEQFSKLFSYNGKIIVSPHAEIMMDVDDQEHLDEILNALK
ncbi:nucleotidyltransferase family protein [Candidatus Pacearchaeota archaeon]|nr:nucleotidyltransferase family protein [Candidatus Pacearchaeota archaeon]